MREHNVRVEGIDVDPLSAGDAEIEAPPAELALGLDERLTVGLLTLCTQETRALSRAVRAADPVAPHGGPPDGARRPAGRRRARPRHRGLPADDPRLRLARPRLPARRSGCSARFGIERVADRAAGRPLRDPDGAAGRAGRAGGVQPAFDLRPARQRRRGAAGRGDPRPPRAGRRMRCMRCRCSIRATPSRSATASSSARRSGSRSAEYARRLRESIIGREVYADLRRQLNKRRDAIADRPPLHLGLELAAMIARVPLFADARQGGGDRGRPTGCGRVVALPDEKIIAAGGPPDAMYFIAAGEVTVVREGSRIVLKEGDFFGEMGLLGQPAAQCRRDLRRLLPSADAPSPGFRPDARQPARGADRDRGGRRAPDRADAGALGRVTAAPCPAKMHLAQFLVHGPTYHSLAMWRHPKTAAAGYDWSRPALYQHIAQVCERGLFDMVFFADLNYISDTYRHLARAGAALRRASAGARSDPAALLHGGGDGAHRRGLDLLGQPAPSVLCRAAVGDARPSHRGPGRLERGDLDQPQPGRQLRRRPAAGRRALRPRARVHRGLPQAVVELGRGRRGDGPRRRGCSPMQPRSIASSTRGRSSSRAGRSTWCARRRTGRRSCRPAPRPRASTSRRSTPTRSSPSSRGRRMPSATSTASRAAWPSSAARRGMQDPVRRPAGHRLERGRGAREAGRAQQPGAARGRHDDPVGATPTTTCRRSTSTRRWPTAPSRSCSG